MGREIKSREGLGSILKMKALANIMISNNLDCLLVSVVILIGSLLNLCP
jgi:hypothetical protein